MIPKITPEQTQTTLTQDYLAKVQTSAFSGDIESSYASRLVMATDNSIYQNIPQAIVYPKHHQDIVTLLKIANTAPFTDIIFSPRGGGTGTNGQSLTHGIVIDMSRYMREIIEINVEEKWVRVQAGVIKDQLNDFLRPYGFFFSPDLSTSNRATVGGMINTDASGQGSLVYGKTSDHVLGLRSVLVDGSTLDTSPMPVEQAQQVAQQTTAEGRIYKQVFDTCYNNRQQILDTFPRLNRFLTGYDLEHVFNDDLTEFDLSRIITGSEGSLAFVTEAKLNLTPIANHKVLVNVKYDSFESALRNSPFLLNANATSVETVDSKVLNLAREDVIWHDVSTYIKDVPNKEMLGLNMVEFNSESAEDIESKIANLKNMLDSLIDNNEAGVIGYQVLEDNAAIGKIYAMRKKAVGLLGNVKGNKKPIAFAEDTAVPPENLADFILEFRALLDSYKLDYGMFGHVDAGVLHVRPALDMCDPEQEKTLRSISDQVVALTAKYGGLMWGEHGKGYRSEYGPDFFGEHLFTELRHIKTAFDPNNRVNPGKICTPIASKEQLVSVDDIKRGTYDRQIPVDVKMDFNTTVNCNGNGLCFNYDVNSPMCPSYKITGDRRYSPKGRAGLMREWLRLATNNDSAADLNSVIKQPSNVFTRLANNRKKAKGDADFSHEVMESMEECLACKACTKACPIEVDVPTFRAKFYQAYYTRYQRPLKDYFVANVESLAPVMAKFPKLMNAIQQSPLVKKLIEKTIGYVDAPALSSPALSKRQLPVVEYNFATLSKLSAEEAKKHVIIVQDPFTSFYEADLLQSSISLIHHLGYKPVLLPFTPNGKAQHVKGFLETFKKTALKSSKVLSKVATLGIPMIGVDASLVLCYRDEYKKELADLRGEFEVLLVNEWLSNIDIAPQNKVEGDEYYLFSHCTEKTNLPLAAHDWQTVFKQFGIKLNLISTGCCGMAGTYGHEVQNQDNSKGLFALSWQPQMDKIDTSKMVATGFSCRSQVKRLNGVKPVHPLEALVKLIS
ncbi:D-2-hydroxyglutarate dehydrogenase YdiJ [Flocculibacter collagenilyticus]|uniref:D-2-hydroxyglutarate dehydrogenase YdiJ n=1 Tax=Flocculibacter collagenilyticus TaxID=2744479 RepID=UPI0018F2D664|nr:FAD-binding and (Fe-S)-binding domain-containing protein [Flocculibacter collagenilyticus]